MKRLHLLFLLALIPLISIAQQNKLDSLKIEFKKTTQDTTKARLLSEIGIAAYYVNSDLAKKHNDTLINFSKGVSDKHLAQGYKMRGVFFLLASDYDNASIWYVKALELAKKNKDKNGEAGFLSSLGDLNARQGNNDIAVDYYLQSINLFKEIDKEVKSIGTYSNLATILSSNNKILRANEYLIEALKIADKYNSDKSYLVHRSIGANYIKLVQYEKAEFHLLKALDLAKKVEDTFTVGMINQSLSVMYDGSLNDYNKALFHAEQSLHHFKLVNNINGMINSYNGIGQQNFQLGNIKKAKKNYLKGFELASKTKDTNALIITNYHLAELFANQGNITQANKHFTDGGNLGGNEYKMYFKNHFWKIGNAFAESKNFKQAYENVKSFAVLSDSLYKENGVDKVIELETKYKTEQKEKENLQLKADNLEQEQLTQQANAQKKMFGIGLLASLLTLGVFAFFYRKNKRQKSIIETLQKELHHRIKNNLSIIDTFIEVAKEEFNDSKFETKLTELQNRIDSINEVHQQLYQSHDVTNLNLKKYIDTLAQNINASFSDSNIHLKTSIDDDLNINADKSFSVGLIVNEFLTNSYKYAFDNSDGEIQIGMKENMQQYELTLSDNGKGLPKDFDIKKTDSFGLRIMKLLTEQLNGTFNLSNSNGVTLQIKFPK